MKPRVKSPNYDRDYYLQRRELVLARTRGIADARRRAGLCVACGEPSKSFTYCAACRKRRREPDNARRRAARATPDGRLHEMIKGARLRARSTGLAFDLTIDDLRPIPSICAVLGIKLRWNGSGPRHHATPSLDRLRPELGYVRGNVAIISMRANSIRSDASADELEAVAAYARRLESENHSRMLGTSSSEQSSSGTQSSVPLGRAGPS